MTSQCINILLLLHALASIIHIKFSPHLTEEGSKLGMISHEGSAINTRLQLGSAPLLLPLFLVQAPPATDSIGVMAATPDLKTFNSSLMPTKFTSLNLDHSQMQSSGGTRWNPMPEQIKLLEALYQGGMRTPNPAQIDRIAAELRKYGRIEGKNVFYWFQNHKARERQKQKRSVLLALAPNITEAGKMTDLHGDGNCNSKRKCRSWGSAELDVEQSGSGDRTLELFPLHPERKQMG